MCGGTGGGARDEITRHQTIVTEMNGERERRSNGTTHHTAQRNARRSTQRATHSACAAAAAPSHHAAVRVERVRVTRGGVPAESVRRAVRRERGDDARTDRDVVRVAGRREGGSAPLPLRPLSPVGGWVR